MDPYASIDDSPLATAYLQNLWDVLNGADADEAERMSVPSASIYCYRFVQVKAVGTADMVAAVLCELGPVEKIMANVDICAGLGPYARFLFRTRIGGNVQGSDCAPRPSSACVVPVLIAPRGQVTVCLGASGRSFRPSPRWRSPSSSG